MLTRIRAEATADECENCAIKLFQFQAGSSDAYDLQPDHGHLIEKCDKIVLTLATTVFDNE
jgi:hypothetical protein